MIQSGTVKVNGVPIGRNATALKAPFNDRVDFDVSKFLNLIETKGYDVTWEKAMYCPQRCGLSPRDHDIACAACDGTGFVYYDSCTTRMFMQSIKLDENYYAYGRFDSGTVMVTALPGFRINFWDRLTLTNGEARFSELLRRQPDTLIDRPKYNALELDQVQYVDRAGAVQVATIETDVDVNLAGQIEWVDAQPQPDAREYYSVAYLHRPVYRVIDLVHQIRESPVQTGEGSGDTQVEFPMQVVAQLDFMVRDESRDVSSENQSQNPFPVRR